LHDFSLRHVLQAFHYGQGIHKVLTQRLGPPTSVISFEGQEWTVWGTTAYTLYALDTYLDLDTAARGLEGALAALQWDLGSVAKPLPRAEWEALQEQGRAAGLLVKREIPNRTQAELRQFVQDYCNGSLICDHQVRDTGILPMVFMPLAFGALNIAPPEKGEEPSAAYLAEQSLRKPLGKEPQVPPVPPEPTKPLYPPEPPKPENWREPDPEQIRVIKDDIAWDVAPTERLENYLEEIHLHNVGVDYYRAQVLIDWEAQKARIDQEHQQALNAHAKVLQKMARANRGIQNRHLRWTERKARQDALLGGFHTGWLADLAVIYEYNSKAGPRGINGYPIFWSFQILSRSDWERARVAITRELERRENTEV
jgi:hypothetical protein